MGKRTMVGLKELKSELENSKNMWKWYATLAICKIPKGKIASYQTVSEYCNSKYYTSITPILLANLRRELYRKTSRATDIPLHRLASKNDICMRKDSAQTRRDGMKRRTEENTYNMIWWSPIS